MNNNNNIYTFLGKDYIYNELQHLRKDLPSSEKDFVKKFDNWLKSNDLKETELNTMINVTDDEIVEVLKAKMRKMDNAEIVECMSESLVEDYIDMIATKKILKEINK